MVFSDTVTNTGIVQQTRALMRVDSTQWATSNITNSTNNWLDRIFNYGVGIDRNFQLDDTNHTKLPIGTTNLIADQSTYSFLTDQDGNRITNITRIDVLNSAGNWTQLKKIDAKEIVGALDEYKKTAGIPQEYDLVADNVVKLYPKPIANVAEGIKYYFQRTPSYLLATDTTKQPGVASFLHRGFVVASAYDGAVALGLPNLNALAVELQKEEGKMRDYFSLRNTDSKKRMIPNVGNNR